MHLHAPDGRSVCGRERGMLGIPGEHAVAYYDERRAASWGMSLVWPHPLAVYQRPWTPGPAKALSWARENLFQPDGGRTEACPDCYATGGKAA